MKLRRLFANASIGFVADLLGILSFAWAILTPLIKWSTLAGHLNWADAAVIGLCTTVVLALAVTASAALWRRFRLDGPATQQGLADLRERARMLEDANADLVRHKAAMEASVTQRDQALSAVAAAARQALTAREELPKVRALTERINAERERQPTPRNPASPIDHRIDDTKYLGEIIEVLSFLRGRLLDTFSEADIGQLSGYHLMEQIARNSDQLSRLTDADRSIWSTPAQKLAWLHHKDHVEGTYARMTALIDFLESRADITATLAALKPAPAQM